MFTPLVSARACRAVLDQINSAILAGHLRVGDKLDRERDLAEQFGVSRPTVREAIRYLREAGVVTVKRGPGGGIFVQEESIPVELLTTATMARREAESALEARCAVELAVLRLAAVRATNEDILFLREILQSFLTGPQTAAQFVAIDTKCHLAVARAAHNDRLYRVMEALMKDVYVALEMVPSTVETFDEAFVKLCAVVDALEAHDASAAREAMDAHYAGAYSAIDNYVA
jgi:GntR family transcriptional regulator, transcriptional repressor for pyruvate dehydrogenase complex